VPLTPLWTARPEPVEGRAHRRRSWFDKLTTSVQENRASTSPGDPWLLAAVWTLAVVALAAAVRLLVWYWPGRVFDGVTSHIWTALAWDFVHGEFYRPPLGPHGYGGTRYMPLLFGTQALLMRFGLDPIHAGVILMQGSVLAAAAALYVSLRDYDVAPRLATPLALTVFATVIYQQYCTDLNPDYLAFAFALSGVPLALRSDRRNHLWRLCAVSVAIVLAALTKVTALAYLVPIAWWLVRVHKVHVAVWFAVGTTALFAAAIAAIEVASHRAFLDSFRATISGGMGSADVWRAVPKFVREIAIDPFVAVPFIAAGWSAFAVGRRRFGLPHMVLITASSITLVIFASPGTVGNHLVDLHIASLFVIGVAIADGQLPGRAAASVFAGMAIALTAISIPVPRIPSVMATLRGRGLPSRAMVRAIHEEFLPAGTRYLSTDPIVAVLNDERPVVLDAFNLNRFVRERTPAGRDLEQRLRRREYDFVILREDHHSPQDRNDLERLVYSSYEVRAVRRPFVILARAW
jgi:hypothetical protein